LCWSEVYGEFDDLLWWVELECGEQVTLRFGEFGRLPERAGRSGEGDGVDPVEVGADLWPGQCGGGLGDSDEEQGEPAEQDMSADTVFEPVVDRSQVQDRFHVPPSPGFHS
jgi:hypothetical protein